MESNGKSGSGGGAKHNNNNNNNNCEDEHQELVEAEEEDEHEEKEEEEEGQGNSDLSDDDDDDEEEEDEDDGGGGGGEMGNTARESSISTARTPFTALSQIDADLALARTLQEQERAYMMLRMNNEGSDYGSWEAGSYLHDDDDEDDFDDQRSDTRDGNGHDADHQFDQSDADDDDDDDDDDDVDAFDVHAHSELDAAEFSSDEAYARALQDAEEREMAARLLALAGIRDREAEHAEDHRGNSQDTWEEVDPGELSYEELLALGEVVGTESRGLSTDTISSLPSIKYKSGSSQNGSNDSCVICREDFEDGETLTILSCKHIYHSECINNWLNINKVCPVCSAEVSTSGHS